MRSNGYCVNIRHVYLLIPVNNRVDINIASGNEGSNEFKMVEMIVPMHVENTNNEMQKQLMYIKPFETLGVRDVNSKLVT
jgi:hypothetical protein